MRVLLVSPMAGVDPACGDVTYTESLLRHPPEGVQYESYTDAMSAGRLRELGRRDDIHRSRGIARLGAFGRVGRERTINALRRRGVLFREPFRHFEVSPGCYDIVHCHVFSASFPGLDAPLVMSNASVIEELYTAARGWSTVRVRMASQVDLLLARLLHVQHTSHRMAEAAAVVAFTEALQRELERRRSCPPSRLHVAPCFVEPAVRRPARQMPRVIGFVAGDFAAKGGWTVLEAFALVRQQRPDATLVVVGSQPRFSEAELTGRGITWLPNVPRGELLERHLPSFDVFAYPTEFDGLPLTVLEVMALGIPVVTSDYRAMPEIIGWDQAGSVVPRSDAPALARELLKLLDPQVNAQARKRTAHWFDAHYTPLVATQKLGEAYDTARRIHPTAVG